MNKDTQVKDIPAVEVVNALIDLNCELQGALAGLLSIYQELFSESMNANHYITNFSNLDNRFNLYVNDLRRFSEKLELMIGYDSGSFLEYEEKQLKELRSIGERFA